MTLGKLKGQYENNSGEQKIHIKTSDAVLSLEDCKVNTKTTLGNRRFD